MSNNVKVGKDARYITDNATVLYNTAYIRSSKGLLPRRSC
jgi:hypothetical protein